MFEQPYLKLVKARIEESRKFIQVILGPRQVLYFAILGKKKAAELH